jgi:hypothetical protein
MAGDAPGPPGAGGGPGGGRGHFPNNSEDVPKVSDAIYLPKNGRSCTQGAIFRLYYFFGVVPTIFWDSQVASLVDGKVCCGTLRLKRQLVSKVLARNRGEYSKKGDLGVHPRHPPATTRWLPVAAAGCRWLPLAAGGCRWRRSVRRSVPPKCVPKCHAEVCAKVYAKVCAKKSTPRATKIHKLRFCP